MKFSCVAIDFDLIFLFVNDTRAAEKGVMDKGFMQLGIVNINSTTLIRNLTAAASTQYNNTEIQCYAINNNNTVLQFSDTGTLLVQGKLLLRPISLY